MPIDRWRLVARISAWLLLAAIAVSVISGWGITRTGVIHRISFGLIDRRRADAIHRAAQAPTVAIFLVHVLVNMKVALSARFPRGNRAVNAVLILIGVLILSAAIFMEQA